MYQIRRDLQYLDRAIKEILKATRNESSTDVGSGTGVTMKDLNVVDDTSK
jgi:hypothetical protein